MVAPYLLSLVRKDKYGVKHASELTTLDLTIRYVAQSNFAQNKVRISTDRLKTSVDDVYLSTSFSSHFHDYLVLLRSL